jgi:polyvinyl alcohol dehydrogenase (cytochrome)
MTLPRAPALALLAATVLLAAAPNNALPDEASSSEASSPDRGRCENAPSPVAVGTAQWNGWGRDTDNSRYQPEPALRAADVPRLALKWAYGYLGAAAAGQPTVVDGRLFAASASGSVSAFDSRTGCRYWSYEAAAGVGTAISVGELAAPKTIREPKPAHRRHARSDARIDAHIEVLKPPSAVFFGDENGMIYALDAQRGTLLWKTPADSDPAVRIAGSPTLHAKRLYVSVSGPEDGGPAVRGAVLALDIGTGTVVWKIAVAVRSAPTVDAERGLLYLATRDAVVALDLADGRQRWVKRTATAADFRSPPILRRLPLGKQIILAADRTGIVYGLDPDRLGEILWQTQIGAEPGRVRIDWGAAADHRSVYVGTSGADAAGNGAGLTALNIVTGKVRWSTPAPAPVCSWGEQHCSHAQSQAVTVMPGVSFSGSLDGHLRAYSTIDGKIVWDMDTAKEYRTVNDVRASGGPLDHGGATVVDGMVYVNSGYGAGAGQPGQVLLAFSFDGK